VLKFVVVFQDSCIQVSASDLPTWWSQHSALQTCCTWSSTTIYMVASCFATSPILL